MPKQKNEGTDAKKKLDNLLSKTNKKKSQKKKTKREEKEIKPKKKALFCSKTTESFYFGRKSKNSSYQIIRSF